MACTLSREKRFDGFELSHLKIGTNYTQIMHEIRIRPIITQNQCGDIPEIDTEKFQTRPITRT